MIFGGDTYFRHQNKGGLTFSVFLVDLVTPHTNKKSFSSFFYFCFDQNGRYGSKPLRSRNKESEAQKFVIFEKKALSGCP
jgi:hypothetical protein